MNIAIVVAGGVGQRLGDSIPKQFIAVEGKPMIMYTLQTLEVCSAITGVVLVCAKEWSPFMEENIRKEGFQKILCIAEGGATRQQSVINGIAAAKAFAKAEDLVSIMDACRPLVTGRVIEENIYAIKGYDAALTALPCYDTMFGIDENNCVNSSPPRAFLVHGHTPETTTLKIAEEVYLRASREGIQDKPLCELMTYYGYRITVSASSVRNFKVTTPEDFVLLQMYLRADKAAANEEGRTLPDAEV